MAEVTIRKTGAYRNFPKLDGRNSPDAAVLQALEAYRMALRDVSESKRAYKTASGLSVADRDRAQNHHFKVCKARDTRLQELNELLVGDE